MKDLSLLPEEEFDGQKWLKKPSLFLACLLIAFLIRIWMSSFGHNFDFESYEIVTDLASRGKNVYAETTRYNYSPVWLWVLVFLRYVFTLHFRTAVAAFVSLTDVAIGWVLYRRGNSKAAMLVLFSPVCMIISGFHNQFDNLSILVALLAVRFVETRTWFSNDSKDWGLSTAQFCGFSALVGLSLLAKHVLIFLPVWLLFHKQLSLSRKVMVLTVPYTIFLLSFAPFIATGWDGIVHNVLFYEAWINAPLYNLFLWKSAINVLHLISPTPFKSIFFILLIATGFFMRKKPLLELLLFYYLFIVLLSSNIFMHYWAIPMVFLAMFNSRFWKWYNGFGLLFSIVHPHEFSVKLNFLANGIALVKWLVEYGYCIMVVILLLAVIDVLRPELLQRDTLRKLVRGRV